MSEPLYDPKCGELAKYFLEGEPKLNTAENLTELAAEIQQAVEDWFFSKQDPK